MFKYRYQIRYRAFQTIQKYIGDLATTCTPSVDKWAGITRDQNLPIYVTPSPVSSWAPLGFQIPIAHSEPIPHMLSRAAQTCFPTFKLKKIQFDQIWFQRFAMWCIYRKPLGVQIPIAHSALQLSYKSCESAFCCNLQNSNPARNQFRICCRGLCKLVSRLLNQKYNLTKYDFRRFAFWCICRIHTYTSSLMKVF